jgi:hypothetical protein
LASLPEYYSHTEQSSNSSSDGDLFDQWDSAEMQADHANHNNVSHPRWLLAEALYADSPREVFLQLEQCASVEREALMAEHMDSTLSGTEGEYFKLREIDLAVKQQLADCFDDSVSLSTLSFVVASSFGCVRTVEALVAHSKDVDLTYNFNQAIREASTGGHLESVKVRRVQRLLILTCSYRV